MKGVYFKLLGVPIGNPEFCDTLTRKRAGKVKDVLDAIGNLQDPQVALTNLRQCASYGKLVYSARNTPFESHKDELLAFDKDVRKCFDELSGLHPDEREWLQATLATRLGGLGLKSCLAHGSACYLSSRSCCHALCAELDPLHTWEVADPNLLQQVQSAASTRR